MAATKDWLLSEVEELISVWEGCRCLGCHDQRYKDKQKKKDAMQEIATKFETTVDDVTKKMKSLRAQHNREKNNVQAAVRSGAGADDIPKFNWVHYNELNFLDEVAGMRVGTRSNLTSQSQANEAEDLEGSDNVADGSMQGNDEEDDDQLPEIPRSTKKPLQGKRTSKKRRMEESEINLLNKAAEALERATMPELQVEKPQSTDDIFGQYVASELKAIDDARLKTFVKHRIQTVIFQCTCNMPMQMPPEMAIPPQMSNTGLLSTPTRNLAQSAPMRAFEPHLARPPSRQEMFRTPSPFQGGPSPSPSPSPASPSTSTDSQPSYMNL